MTARSKIIKEIVDKMDNIPNNQLEKVLSYVEKISNLSEKKKKILSFAGCWKDIDDDLFSDLTENLHKNRLMESNNNVSE